VIGSIDNNVVASYNYIGKNLLGQMGSLYYILNTGNNIDKNPRKYINRSIIFNSTSIYIECITPLLPVNSFLLIAGSANLLKNISWTSYGSVNAKIIQTLSIDNNISEIYSKITVLNTVSSSIGMCVGLGLAAKIPDNNVRLSIVPVLTFLRWYTLNKAIKDII
jgi:hypothetical protein